MLRYYFSGGVPAAYGILWK